MARKPVYEIDPQAFWQDPYPDLKRLRAETPVAYVPQLDAVLITRRDDIFREEKRIDVFSSDQPDGLMTRLMGQNMMRKDGAAHLQERKAIFPSVSPKTVKQHWLSQFRAATLRILEDMAPKGRCDLVRDYAMPVSAEALKAVTGLTRMRAEDMDAVSQGMIDGCANYAGDPAVEARCHESTRLIDEHISEMWEETAEAGSYSLLRVQQAARLPEDQIRANIKLAISGGQNEPRDAIAGTVWALLRYPDQLACVRTGEATWMEAFEEYARWISPIGMSPRRVARPYCLRDVDLEPGERVFFMFGSGNRDESKFARPDAYDIRQDISAAISFGAGPHFCAGAWISRALIAEVALPMLFERLQGLTLDGEAHFGGWAFRGPLSLPVRWEGCR
ncbi:cytochrome P450 [Phycobacter azelaicus]|uniref:cytochrome P450 n=1 Tax=Phycobacter azelaicus TaxID=2668075 RepID=UPI001868BDA6|nr:cytochrome P450 [Phycobacter azelaicus]